MIFVFILIIIVANIVTIYLYDHFYVSKFKNYLNQFIKYLERLDKYNNKLLTKYNKVTKMGVHKRKI